MKIIIADDHALIRDGLEQTLQALGPDVCVFQAADRASVLDQLDSQPDVDIVLLDLFMPGAEGFNLLKTVCNNYSHIPVIIISASEDPHHMREAIDCGASGFVQKSTSNELLISAIKLVSNGGVYIPTGMLQTKQPAKQASLERHNDKYLLVVETKRAANSLTKRQNEVLTLMSMGMANKEIARAYNISENTVKIHVTAILKLFNAENRTEAVVMAHNAGIIQA